MKQENRFLDELKWRGLLYQTTEGAEKVFNEPTVFYWGNDLTADSLHVGHLLGLVVMKRAIKFGHKPIILTASGTSMVGDPSGKEKERPIMSREEIEKNKAGIKKQIEKVLEGEIFKLMDNHDWLSKIGLLEFLRDAGKYITLNSMLDKESVKTRLERESGISFAEFSYQLLQAYDFLYLHENHGCQAQLAGSDQWGNMVQGVDLIRKKLSKQVCAVSWPLIEDPATGKKFGKSAVGKTIWLDGQKTHPFEFYQFFVNIEDSAASQLMRFYSFKSEPEVLTIEKKWQENKDQRLLQKELAFEVTGLVHGKEEAKKVKSESEIFFRTEKEFENLSDKEKRELSEAFDNLGENHPLYEKNRDFDSFEPFKQVFVSGIENSTSASVRLVKQGGYSYIKVGKYRIQFKGKKVSKVVDTG